MTRLAAKSIFHNLPFVYVSQMTWFDGINVLYDSKIEVRMTLHDQNTDAQSSEGILRPNLF